MKIRVLVNGAQGRMGQIAALAIAQDAELELVGETGRQDSLREAIKNTQAQVVVDLTNAEAVLPNAMAILEAGAYPVIGTSGLKTEQIQILQTYCRQQQLGGIIAPNFSIAAMLMIKYAGEIARYLPEVEIIEMHHDGKLDSPSATALKTAEILSTTRLKPAPTKVPHETIPGARGALHHGIAIHAIRLPGLVAQQAIVFGGIGETLTIRHDAIDRQCFMPGICLACKKVITLKELVYGLEHIL